MENVDIKLITRDDLDDILAISGESFPAEYNVTKVSLRQKLIDDADKFDEGSLIIREAASGKPIGFIGTKISHSELYPDTGWISIVAVARDYRRNGYGRILVEKALEALKNVGVKRVSVGQEFHNFFSGIPNPNDENMGFFNALG
ncbi:MAG: GNAT family N-acetyltransferase, partial [Lachnospiraceae bacterium]|nr:GNAT family N-acetyltransferase [Lachnospiraceae bacterium]